MNTTFKDRLLAFLIDFMIMIIFTFIIYLLFNNNNLITLNSELDTLKDNYLNNKVNLSQYIHAYAEIAYDIDKIQVMPYIIDVIFIMIYYILIPFFKNGQTLGKKIIHIKVVEENDKYLGLNNLTLRSFITTGLLAMLISLALIYLVPAWIYFVTVSIVNFIQLLLVIISTFMIIYRRDKRGLEDILGKTKVVKE